MLKRERVPQYAIEDDIPLTQSTSALEAVFGKLEVGQSFLVETVEDLKRLYPLLQKIQKKMPNRKFATRHQEGGTRRVWRTK
jgi:hypothetical protein